MTQEKINKTEKKVKTLINIQKKKQINETRLEIFPEKISKVK